jgi:4'-phosphopantetheinyl transferase
MLNVHDGQVEFLSCVSLLNSEKNRPLHIVERDVHVWGAVLEEPGASVETGILMLGTTERMRAARFVRDLDRRRYVLAHATVRVILGRYLDCSPEAVPMQSSESGKPYLRSSPSHVHALWFNLAHSGNRLLLGISRGCEIGVDIEQVRECTDAAGLAARFYSPREREHLAVLSPESQRQEFFRYWVAKEAVLKGKGVGMTSLESCEIVPSENPARALGKIKDPNSVESEWTVSWLSCGPDWHAAVAYTGKDRTVRCMPPRK